MMRTATTISPAGVEGDVRDRNGAIKNARASPCAGCAHGISADRDIRSDIADWSRATAELTSGSGQFRQWGGRDGSDKSWATLELLGTRELRVECESACEASPRWH